MLNLTYLETGFGFKTEEGLRYIRNQAFPVSSENHKGTVMFD